MRVSRRTLALWGQVGTQARQGPRKPPFCLPSGPSGSQAGGSLVPSIDVREGLI